MENLTTDRLSFRQWQESDYEAFASYFSNKELAKYVGGIKSREESWRLMATYMGHYHLKGYSYLALVERDSKELVGTVGLWNSEPWPDLELGYWLLPEMQGKGYALEAAEKVKEFAFKEIIEPRLVSYIDPENKPSIRLAEKMGAKLTETAPLLDFGDHHVFEHYRKDN